MIIYNVTLKDGTVKSFGVFEKAYSFFLESEDAVFFSNSENGKEIEK